MAIKALDSTLPAATTLTDKKGEPVKLFLVNNPWKVLAPSELYNPKVFQYCIMCGDARFSAESWSRMTANRIGSTILCDKESCLEKDTYIQSFALKHLILTEEDIPSSS